MNASLSAAITDSIINRISRMTMDDCINEASCMQREFTWVDTRRSASLDRKHGQMRSPGLIYWSNQS